MFVPCIQHKHTTHGPLMLSVFVGYSSRIKNYYVQVWKELARAGNFTVQWVFVPPKQDEGSTEYLLRYVDEVDVVGGISYFDTPSRRQKNLVFVRNPGPRLDLIMIGPSATVQQPTNVERMSTFLKPFDMQLWLVIMGGIVLTAIVMYYFEHGDIDGSDVYNNDETTSLLERLHISLWMAFTAFTGEYIQEKRKEKREKKNKKKKRRRKEETEK